MYLGLPGVEYHFYDLARNIDRVDADLLNGFIAHEVNGVDVLPGPDGLFGLTDVPLKEPLNYPLSFQRECLERGDSGRCLGSHWFFEPFSYPVPVVGRR